MARRLLALVNARATGQPITLHPALRAACLPMMTNETATPVGAPAVGPLVAQISAQMLSDGRCVPTKLLESEPEESGEAVWEGREKIRHH